MSFQDMVIRIRDARPADAAVVAGLLVELGYPDNPVAAVERRLAMWAGEPSSVVQVAKQADRIVGVIALTAIPYLEREGRRGRIVALVVSEQCRGHGVGRQLVDGAEQAARALGCVTMEVTSSRTRTESHPFYRTLGYEDGGHRSTRYQKNLVRANPEG